MDSKLTAAETITKLAKMVTDKVIEDGQFRIRIMRRPGVGGDARLRGPESFAIFEGASLEHIQFPEKWLPYLAASTWGTFELQIFNPADLTIQQIGSSIQWVKSEEEGLDGRAGPDLDAVRLGWAGPPVLTSPQRKKSRVAPDGQFGTPGRPAFGYSPQVDGPAPAPRVGDGGGRQMFMDPARYDLRGAAGIADPRFQLQAPRGEDPQIVMLRNELAAERHGHEAELRRREQEDARKELENTKKESEARMASILDQARKDTAAIMDGMKKENEDRERRHQEEMRQLRAEAKPRTSVIVDVVAAVGSALAPLAPFIQERMAASEKAAAAALKLAEDRASQDRQFQTTMMTKMMEKPTGDPAMSKMLESMVMVNSASTQQMMTMLEMRERLSGEPESQWPKVAREALNAAAGLFEITANKQAADAEVKKEAQERAKNIALAARARILARRQAMNATQQVPIAPPPTSGPLPQAAPPAAPVSPPPPVGPTVPTEGFKYPAPDVAAAPVEAPTAAPTPPAPPPAPPAPTVGPTGPIPVQHAVPASAFTMPEVLEAAIRAHVPVETIAASIVQALKEDDQSLLAELEEKWDGSPEAMFRGRLGEDWFGDPKNGVYALRLKLTVNEALEASGEMVEETDDIDEGDEPGEEGDEQVEPSEDGGGVTGGPGEHEPEADAELVDAGEDAPAR